MIKLPRLSADFLSLEVITSGLDVFLDDNNKTQVTELNESVNGRNLRACIAQVRPNNPSGISTMNLSKKGSLHYPCWSEMSDSYHALMTAYIRFTEHFTLLLISGPYSYLLPSTFPHVSSADFSLAILCTIKEREFNLTERHKHSSLSIFP